MGLRDFVLAKLAGWKLPLGIGAAGVVAGAAASRVADKRREKWTAKRFYWLGRKGTRPGRPDGVSANG